MTVERPARPEPVRYGENPQSATGGDRFARPAFRLSVVLAAHRDTILWLAAEADRWRWEVERLRDENAALRRTRFCFKSPTPDGYGSRSAGGAVEERGGTEYPTV